MAFGNISTFYLPTAANAGASQWGSDVRKLLSAADAGNDATTKTSHGTSGNTLRTCDPYTTATADLAQADYGWAVVPSDMNSVVGARRFIPAGNHVLTIRTASNQSDLATVSQYTVYVYRISNAAGGRARTLLGSATGAAFSYGGVANTYRTETVTVALAEIIFEADETIQYSIEQLAPAVAVLGRVNSHDTGTQGGVAIRVDQPGLKVLADADGTSTGSGIASADAGWIFAGVGSSDGVGAASGVASWVASGVGSAAGIAEALGIPGTTWSFTGDAAGIGDALGVMTGIFGAVGIASGVADMSGVATGIFSAVGSAAGVGDASADAGWIFAGVGSMAGVADVLGLMSSVAGTVGSAEGFGEALGLPSIVLGTVGTVDIGGGGGSVTIISPVIIFDD